MKTGQDLFPHCDVCGNDVEPGDDHCDECKHSKVCDTCGNDVEPEDDHCEDCCTHCEDCCTLTEREYWNADHHSEEDYPGRQIQDA